MYIRSSLYFFLPFLGIFPCRAIEKSPLYTIHRAPNETALLCHISLAAQNAWQTFDLSCFKVPLLLEYASKNKFPVILVLPKKLEGFSPLDNNAPWIEGARTALTWASVYKRFPELGPCNVHIIHSNTEAIPQTAELQAIFDSIFGTLKSLINSDIFFTPYRLEEYIPDPITFSPKLSNLKPNQKRILITGGAGFLGSHLTKQFIALGDQVVVIDNLSYGSLNNLDSIMHDKNLVFFNHDVSYPFDIMGPITHIIHAASLPSPPCYYKNPIPTLRAGLHGTRSTLELALKKNARYLFTSTSEVYGDPEVSPQAEDYPGNVDPIGKRSQYDQSKRGAETLIKLYFEKYGIDARIVRIFNTYGPYMTISDGRVVTNFIGAILNNETISIFGSGEQTRSFGYVTDTVDGIIKVLNADLLTRTTLIKDRVYNIGTPHEFTINELAGKIDQISKKYLNRPALITHYPQPDPSDPKRRKPDITRAIRHLDFNPNIMIDEGLEKTFLYFYQNTTGSDNNDSALH